MANQNSKIDENHRHTIMGITDDGNAETRRLLVDATTGRLKIDAIINADPFYFGDASTNGTWRIATSGNNLAFQRREAGTYVTKFEMTP